MATDDITIQVDAGARAILVRNKIDEMRGRGYHLTCKEPTLPTEEGARVTDAMTLTFHHPNFVRVEAPGVTGPSAPLIIEAGRFENLGPGAGLSAGPL